MNVSVGHRVRFHASIGTVKYIGPVQGRGETVWVGIEWDNPSRGKHDGFLEGVRYFSCVHPTGASFVKSASLGHAGRQSLLEAIRLRFGCDGASVNVCPSSDGTASGHTTATDADSSREESETTLSNTTSVSVSGMGVCSVNNSDNLAQFVPNLRVLDLRDSLLSQPLDILRLLEGLPQLHTLDLTANRFAWDSECISTILQRTRIRCSENPFPLRVAVFNKCKLSWDIIVAICSACSNLEELRLHSSNLGNMLRECPHLKDSCNISLPASIRLLDLNGNSLSWECIVCTFGHLPSLCALYAGDNCISSVELNSSALEKLSVASSIQIFQGLSLLSLSFNPIADWRSINELASLTNLRELRISGIPLFDTAPGSEYEDENIMKFRGAIIARLQSLHVLDGTIISKDERTYAEKKYVQEILDRAQGSHIRAQLLEEHPRLPELCSRYDICMRTFGLNPSGRPKDCAKPHSIRNGFAHFDFVLRDEFRDFSQRTVAVDLPVTILASKLYGFVGRIFNIRPSSEILRLDLAAAGAELPQIRRNLFDDSRDMKYYGFQPGSYILVEVYRAAREFQSR